MHSFLKAIGFSQISKREEMKKIILDVIKNYDKKNVIQDYPDGTFAEFSRNYGNDCGITVCGQYDEEDRFHVEYYYPFFRGTGVTTQEAVTVEKHVDKNAFSGACDDLRIGITLIFYLQNAAEYMKESGKEKIDNHFDISSELFESQKNVRYMNMYLILEQRSKLLKDYWDKVELEYKNEPIKKIDILLSIAHMHHNRLVGIDREKEKFLMACIEYYVHALNDKEKYYKKYVS